MITYLIVEGPHDEAFIAAVLRKRWQFELIPDLASTIRALSAALDERECNRAAPADAEAF